MRLVKLLGATAAIAGGLGLATAANAAPLNPGALDRSAGEARIEKVRQGCGPGAHRNVYGDCRYDVPPRGYGGDGCGPGGHRNVYGQCRGNQPTRQEQFFGRY